MSFPYAGGALSEGGGVLNHWQLLPSTTALGLTWTVNDDGSISISGKPTSAWCAILAGNMPLSSTSLYAGGEFSLSLSGAVHSVARVTMMDGSDKSLLAPSTNKTGRATFKVPAGCKRVQFALIVQDSIGVDVSETVHPMLNDGDEPLPYVPYL